MLPDSAGGIRDGSLPVMPLDPDIARRDAEVAALGSDASHEQREAIVQRPYGEVTIGTVEIRDEVLSGPHGAIPIRVYSAAADSERGGAPALIWCHGGGFMWGGLDMTEADQTSRVIADRIGGVVVSVDYRLVGDGQPPLQPPIPDDLVNAYPVAHDEVVHVFRWAVAQAEQLGIDPERIALGGGSAGANLAAGAVLRLVDEGGPLPHVWLPIYPFVHSANPEFSAELEADLAEHGSGFSDEAVAFLAQCYGATAADRYGFIGDQRDLSGLPRCLIVNDQYDELRGSGERLAEQLRAAGVDVTCTTALGVKHGHLNLVGHPAAIATLEDMARAILA